MLFEVVALLSPADRLPPTGCPTATMTSLDSTPGRHRATRAICQIMLLFLAWPAWSQADPRIEIVRLQAADRLEEALEAVDSLAEMDAPEARASAEYLRGHLLARLRKDKDAVSAFAGIVGTDSVLSNTARLRLAELQEQLGFAPAAAALATEVLMAFPSGRVAVDALGVIDRTLDAGGDCRLLDRLAQIRLRANERRTLSLVAAKCALRDGDRARARALLIELIDDKHIDLTGFLAADLLDELTLEAPRRDPVVDRLLAEAFFHHRRFDRSVPLLMARVPVTLPPVRGEADFATHFNMVRGQYWQGEFVAAARGYSQLAQRSIQPGQRARALHHQGRSLELADRWREAKVAYMQAHLAEPEGPLSGSALIGALRLHARSGEKADARRIMETMESSYRLRSERVQAALFLASSNLSQTRVEGVEELLDTAATRGETVTTLYWRGRLEELRGEPAKAIDHYLDALERDYYHPIAQQALARLDRDDLRMTALNLGRRFAADGRRPFATWVLLGSQSADGRKAFERLRATANARSRTGSITPTTAVAVESWPLWQKQMTSVDDLLLGLGIWSESGAAAERHFPLSQPNLAFTAALELQRAGRVRQGLLIAESLAKRVPRGTPDPVVPAVFRKVLYPYSYRYIIETAARHYDIDPLLLTAIIREESRFDPKAASQAAARGLTQFIIPTAERYQTEIGYDQMTPADLESPDVAVALGAAYLRDLGNLFSQRAERMVAAYNAGEAQSEAWSDYCHSRDPAEFITKIAFAETRNYVVKVLRSHAQYRELYDGSFP